MSGEIVTSPLTWCIVGIAFIGSLFACRGLADRFWFTLVMPVVYAMLFFLCLLIIGGIAGNFFPPSHGESLTILAILLSSITCLSIFVLQVCSMAKDTCGGSRGYSIRTTRKRYANIRPATLQRLPTRKRWSG
ncbi:MAG: hypothetical protein ACI8XO_002476 [Verrucomicrobiales bacterium]|jgi:hypothetical protein